MKKSFLKRSFVTYLILTLLLFTFSPAVMATNLDRVKEVFPQEEVSELLEQVRFQNLTSDKVLPPLKKAKAGFSIRAGNDVIGTYPTRPGVILVTPDKFLNLIPLGHSAIIRTSSTVVEATAKGVVIGPNNWYRTKNRCYAVTVKETTPEQDLLASEWCYGQLKKPYNFNYYNPWTRSRFYCSQLVWAAFKDKYGIDLDTYAFGDAIHPLELVTSSKTQLIFSK